MARAKRSALLMPDGLPPSLADLRRWLWHKKAGDMVGFAQNAMSNPVALMLSATLADVVAVEVTTDYLDCDFYFEDLQAAVAVVMTTPPDIAHFLRRLNARYRGPVTKREVWALLTEVLYGRTIPFGRGAGNTGPDVPSQPQESPA